MAVGAPPLPRAQFPVSARFRYLNHANIAPLSRAAAEVGHAFLDEALHDGAVGFEEWDRRVEDVRASAARLMGVPATDVAFVKNTTEGLAFVARGLDWQPGDRVVSVDRDFRSAAFPWLALRERGVVVDLVEPEGEGRRTPIDAFARALDAAPARLVAVSWVNYARGWRIDLPALAQLCRDHGALLCVDVIQGLGVIPADLDDWGVDFATADAHKWMLGPLGTGVLYVAEQRRDLLRPVEPGWNAVVDRDEDEPLDLVYDHTARRFEGGSLTMETILQMGASIELLLSSRVERVWAHVTALLDHLVERLLGIGASVVTDLDPRGRSGHVTFVVPDLDPMALHQRLRAEHVVCSLRSGGIRVSPHGYNTADEIDALIAVVADLTGAGRA